MNATAAANADLLPWLVAGHPDGILVVDRELRCTVWNAAMERISGVAAERVLGQTVEEVFRLARVSGDKASVQRALQGEIVHTPEREVPLSEAGRRAFFEEYNAPLRDNAGQIVGAIVSFRDTTERRRAETAALRASDARFRTLIAHAPAVLFALDSNGTFTLSDGLGLDALGFRPGEAVGRSVWELYARYPEVLQDVRSALAGEPVSTTYRIGGRVLSTWLGPLPGTAGEEPGVIGIATDITDRTRAEEALELQRTRFVELFQSAPEAIALLDEKDCVIDLNREFTVLFGYTADEARGQPINTLVIPSDRQEEAQAITERVACGETLDFDTVRRHKNGRTIPVSVLARPFRAQGCTQTTYAIYRDISERRHAEAERELLLLWERDARAEAERANRAKSEFLAIMSHELRTPLNAVIGYSELLQDEIRGPLNDAQKEQLGRIADSGWHLLDLINQVLSLARIEAGKEDLRPERLNASALARDAAAMVMPQATRKELHLHVEVSDASIPLYSDPGKLRQILLNFLSNAVKFTDRGEVSLEVSTDPNGTVRFQVRDSGIGIASEHLERIWEPFLQVDTSTTRQVGGTGLGLSVCRQLAALLGAEVSVKSCPGKGSTFALLIPPSAAPESGV